MTQEEKAKRYDEAIEKAGKIHNEHKAQPFDVMLKVFPELKENDDEKIKKWLIELVEEVRKANPTNVEHNGMCSEALAWLEKQGETSHILSNSSNIGKDEQKPDDKVEPKFHEGDWVVVNDGRIGRIIECTKDFADVDLEFSCLSTRVNNIRSWTIQDAKGGDVLYTPKGCGVEGIFLIKGWKQVECSGKTLCSSIGYRVKDDEIVAGGLGAIWWKGVIDPFYPATKEQRDLLFQKMREAGYEWDTEKKELKKIEQNPAEWHREDEQNLNACLGYIPDEFLRRWLTGIIHVKYDKPAWSECKQ